MVGAQVLAAVALALLFPGGSSAAIGFAVIYGIANGMTALLRATLVADQYGLRGHGAVAGMLSAVVLVARAAAPLAAGLIALLPGHHATLLGVLVLGLLGSAGLANATTRRRLSAGARRTGTRRAREDRRDARAGSRHGRAAPCHCQSQRASPLVKDLVRDARVRQGRQGRLLVPKRAQVQDRVRDVRSNDTANLDDGAMWPTSFALKELTAAEEASIGALVKKAVS
jgi:MFS family permease